LKPDKFFFNNQNIIDKESNFLYSMGRDFIHKISLDKLSCYIPDVGYVEYYSQWKISRWPYKILLKITEFTILWNIWP